MPLRSLTKQRERSQMLSLLKKDQLNEELDDAIKGILRMCFDSSSTLQAEKKLFIHHETKKIWCRDGFRVFIVIEVTFIVNIGNLDESDDWVNLKKNIQTAITSLHKKPQFANVQFVNEYRNFSCKNR